MLPRTTSGILQRIICYETAYKGPSFLIEPPTKVEFSNSTGAWIDCTTTGNPAPTIEWVSIDGMTLVDIPGNMDKVAPTIEWVSIDGMTLVDIPGNMDKVAPTIEWVSIDGMTLVDIPGNMDKVAPTIEWVSIDGMTLVDIPGNMDKVAPTIEWVSIDGMTLVDIPGNMDKVAPTIEWVSIDGMTLVDIPGNMDKVAPTIEWVSIDGMTLVGIPGNMDKVAPTIEWVSIDGMTLVDIPGNMDKVAPTIEWVSIDGMTLVDIPGNMDKVAPTIEWVSIDGMTLVDIPGVRRTVRNGTLILYPFSAGGFRQDIHSAIYRCIASNSVGRIISRDVQIRAVVLQSYKVDVVVLGAARGFVLQSYKVDVVVLGAARGCTAILQCVIPSFVKDLVRVISWLQEPSFHIYPSLQGDGKFHVLPTGELLVSNLDFTDQFPTYKCRTMHRLTRHVVISSPANVRINDHRSLVPPSVVGLTATVQVGQDEGAVMVCLAQACPHSDYRWYRTDHNMEPLLVLPGPRTRVLGPILAIEGVTAEDSGTYRCSSSNIGGEATAEVRLQVSTPYRVDVNPPLLSVHLDGSANFQCEITPYDSGPYLIAWFKDGRQIPGRTSSTSLVINPVGREDRGIYQCIARRSDGDVAQGSAELQLGDTPPILTYSFIEQTLQPGPAVSLKCIASGNPTPDIGWTLDGFELPTNNRFVIGQFVSGHGDVISHVNISHVTVEDGGEYACVAENRAGTVTHSARLNIYGLPYVRLIPKVTAIDGESLSIKCPVAGYPIEEVHWEKGGRELPDGIRQKIQPGGVLTISPVQKDLDTGVYTCWARNKQGHSARRSGEIVVTVPPKLSPTNPERTLNVGERASLICSITKGDIPLTIKWLKDGRYLDNSAALSITHVDQYNSMLVIDSVSARHSGNYSCTVRNMVAEDTQVQRLIVNVPPKIESFAFPFDGLPEGARTRVICGVTHGDPPLTIRWLKDGKPLSPRFPVNVSDLDSFSSLLSINSVSAAHSGEYTCVASNTAAQARYSSKLQVKVPPRWVVEPSDVHEERNRAIMLNCQAEGVPEPTVVWKKAKDNYLPHLNRDHKSAQ
ncbi:hypothetical protein M8J77_020362 [Diaphorina citri]|nr:hypothetical protein M8J77_020362 [Diaphorina citri]